MRLVRTHRRSNFPTTCSFFSRDATVRLVRLLSHTCTRRSLPCSQALRSCPKRLALGFAATLPAPPAKSDTRLGPKQGPLSISRIKGRLYSVSAREGKQVAKRSGLARRNWNPKKARCVHAKARLTVSPIESASSCVWLRSHSAGSFCQIWQAPWPVTNWRPLSISEIKGRLYSV